MERYKEYKDSGVNMEHSNAQWFEHERTGWQRRERAKARTMLHGFCPYRAHVPAVDNPGRCPGLEARCPFRATFTIQNWR